MYHSGSSYGVVRNAERELEVEQLGRRGGTSFLHLSSSSIPSPMSNLAIISDMLDRMGTDRVTFDAYFPRSSLNDYPERG